VKKLEPALPSPWLIACVVVCLAALMHNMTGYALFDPDEGRNAEIAREMVTTGDYVLPHLNGLPYLDKPTLYFAVGAVTMKVLGPTVFAARFPSLLFTLATVSLVAWFARRLFGRGAGMTAAIATAATPFTLAYARIVIFDSTLTFFVVLALVGFYLAIDERIEGGQADRRTGGRIEAEDPAALPRYRLSASGVGSGEGWTALAWVAIGFGVLTKGPIAIALPVLIALPFALRYRAWRSVVDPIALLLFGAIVAPWVIAVSLRIPGFLEYALITETARRFSTSELGRAGPFWYFLAIFPAAALPWSLVLAGSGRSCFQHRDENGRLDRRILFLLLWIALPLVFFTLSQSKRPQYVLPMIPAIALLISASWQGRSARIPGARGGAIGLVALGLFFAATSKTIPNLVPASPEIAAAIPRTAATMGTVCLGAGVLAWFAHRRKDLLLLALSIPVAAIPLSSHALMEAIGNERSAAWLADAITDAGGNSVRVVGVGAYPPSLPFYLQNTMTVATADGSELTSNYLTRHIHQYRGFGSTLRRADWWQEALLTCSEPTVFVVSSEDAVSREALSHLSLIVATDKYVAYGPCGRETLARMGR
jgi:4-amino-4-deoxy-L-arabinose transferase-like glycosyltransferase